MEIKSLSGREICAIIKTCAETNMRELRVGDLHMQFGPSDQGKEIPQMGAFVPSIPTEVVEQDPEQDESFITSMQARSEEDVINTQTLMDDPLAFEEGVMNSFVFKDGPHENQ